jgi:hypothetical protein
MVLRPGCRSTDIKPAGGLFIFSPANARATGQYLPLFVIWPTRHCRGADDP